MSSSGRERLTLKAPPEPASLERFPRRTLRRGTRLWRAVRAGRNPWWFSSALTGRFDLPPPEGTCYLATEDLGAILEILGPGIRGGIVSETFLSERRLHHLKVPRKHVLAELADRRAAGFGVTAEIHTVVPYDLPQAWARALRSSGVNGLSYRLRHDPSFESGGIALFGKEGERKSFGSGREIVVGQELRNRLLELCNVRVMPIPRASELEIIERDS